MNSYARAVQNSIGNCALVGLASHFDGCSLKGPIPPVRDPARADNSELLFQPLGYSAPMTRHVKGLPTEQNGIRTDVLGNVVRVERMKLLAVFPVK